MKNPTLYLSDLKPGMTGEVISLSNSGAMRQRLMDLGLVEGIPVYGGGGDITFVNIGAGCVDPGDTHIYTL